MHVSYIDSLARKAARKRTSLRYRIRWHARNYADVALRKVGLVRLSNVRSASAVNCSYMSDRQLTQASYLASRSDGAIPGITACRDAISEGITDVIAANASWEEWAYGEQRWRDRESGDPDTSIREDDIPF